MSATSPPAVRKGYVPTSRGEIHYRTVGAGARHVVFLACVSTGGLGFHDVLPLMAARGYRAVAIDIMGYGRSDRMSGEWLMGDFADNLAEAMRALDVRPTRLVAGHFSALVAIELAARGTAGIERLVLDGAYIASAEARARQATRAPATAWHEDGRHMREAWTKAYAILKRVDPGLTLDAHPNAALREHALDLMAHFAFDQDVSLASSRFDTAQRISAIVAPTLVVSSEADWNYPHLGPIAALVPGARTHVFPGVHPLHQLGRADRAGEYVEVIEDFFAPSG
ncbi:MAG: alpha/beta hydrolase [Rhodospirillaceae bacterium]|nr:alpha/beta hydrolase [Rhodospirillaceae bacterium]